MHNEYSEWLPTVLMVAKKAASSIMEFYQQKDVKKFQTRIKADFSPVTSADMSAHHIIAEELLSFTPNIPLISEEGMEIPFKERALWSRYWLVDPLDGTKEFIEGTGEFSVNIALIENHTPVLGVVVAPVFEEAYWAVQGQPAYYQKGNSNPKRMRVNTDLQPSIKVAVSRRHAVNHPALAIFLKQMRTLYEGKATLEFIHCGSALKICLVALGKADLYPRFGVTGEWDTAAGQCILEAAGGRLCDLSGNSLKYNLKKSLMNTGFIAIGVNELNNIFCG